MPDAQRAAGSMVGLRYVQFDGASKVLFVWDQNRDQVGYTAKWSCDRTRRL